MKMQQKCNNMYMFMYIHVPMSLKLKDTILFCSINPKLYYKMAMFISTLDPTHKTRDPRGLKSLT